MEKLPDVLQTMVKDYSNPQSPTIEFKGFKLTGVDSSGLLRFSRCPGDEKLNCDLHYKICSKLNYPSEFRDVIKYSGCGDENTLDISTLPTFGISEVNIGTVYDLMLKFRLKLKPRKDRQEPHCSARELFDRKINVDFNLLIEIESYSLYEDDSESILLTFGQD